MIGEVHEKMKKIENKPECICNDGYASVMFECPKHPEKSKRKKINMSKKINFNMDKTRKQFYAGMPAAIKMPLLKSCQTFENICCFVQELVDAHNNIK